jgi:hypothetical protein
MSAQLKDDSHEHEFTAKCWIDDQPCCEICGHCVHCGDPAPAGPTAAEQELQDELESEERRRIYFGRKRR